MPTGITPTDLPDSVREAIEKADRELGLAGAKVTRLSMAGLSGDSFDATSRQIEQHNAKAVIQSLCALTLILGQIEADLAALGKVP